MYLNGIFFGIFSVPELLMFLIDIIKKLQYSTRALTIHWIIKCGVILQYTEMTKLQGTIPIQSPRLKILYI